MFDGISSSHLLLVRWSCFSDNRTANPSVNHCRHLVTYQRSGSCFEHNKELNSRHSKL